MASIEEERAKEMLTASWTLAPRPCDSCNSSPSLVFCRVDSAFLCLPCDTAIHAAARSGHSHARVWVCEVCEHAPASVTCRADAAALCGTCDADVHAANPLARRHERVPVVPFHESPSTVRSLHRSLFDGPISCGHACGEEEEEAASWLVSDLHPKGSEATDLGSRELCFSDPYVDVDYTCVNDSVVPVPTTKGFGFPGLSVPSSIENCVVELDFRRSTATTYSHATASSLSQTVSSSSLDVGVDVVPDWNINISATTDISKPFDPILKQDCVTVSGLDREARVQRYREKRKNRKFKKMIRYASRKVYAETRPRIKGRFAKRTEINGDADQFYSAMPALVPDGGYGVVPSFWAS